MTHTLLFNMVLPTTDSEKNFWLEINFIFTSLHNTQRLTQILSF
jgi:hypothetical protein